MKKIIFVLILACFITSCTSNNKKEEKYHFFHFSYKILEKTEYKFKSNKKIFYNIASVLISFPDTNVTVNEICEYIKTVCINENIISGKFYKTEECWKMDKEQGELDTKIFSECYLGQIDLRTRGLNWKYTIRANDFYFNNKGGIQNKFNRKN
jgi:hypothetical protein